MSDAPTFDWSVPAANDAVHRLRLGAYLSIDQSALPANTPSGLTQPDGILLLTSGAMVLESTGTAGLVTESLGDLSIAVESGALKVAADVLSTFGARTVVLNARPPVSDTVSAEDDDTLSGDGNDTVKIHASQKFDVGEGQKDGTVTFQAKDLEIKCSTQTYHYDVGGHSTAKGAYHVSTSDFLSFSIYTVLSLTTTPFSITVGAVVWYSGITRVALTGVVHETCGYKYENAAFLTGLKGLVSHSLDNAAGNFIVDAEESGFYNANTGVRSVMPALRVLQGGIRSRAVGLYNRMLG